MHGLDNLRKMRRAGLKPSVVFVETQPMAKWTRKFTDAAGDWVDLHLDPKDVNGIELADLRALVGVPNVIVNGFNDGRTEQIGRACVKAGAKVVTVVFYDGEVNPFLPAALVRSIRMTNEGDKTWQR